MARPRDKKRPHASRPPKPAVPSSSRLPLAIALGLATVGIAVFGRVYALGFVNYDDPDYVTANPHVLGGLTLSGVRWALSSTADANWFPLTWISHMTDVTLFGVSSAASHLVNAALHLTTTVLLFLLLVRMTRAVWRSAFVAFVFGFHPLHVESVAWIAERKDVLSGLFGVLTLWAYVHYVDRPTTRRYLLLAGVFALALTTKSMLVTLPLLMLCLDFWPLQRLSRAAILEKVPLLVLAAAVSAVTFESQRSAGAISTHSIIPLGDRLLTAIVNYGICFRQAMWPARLSAFYPWSAPSVALAVVTAAALVGAGVLAVRLRRTHPYLLTGYAWFLIGLLPVIGIVQLGLQAHADRYMYLPIIGLAIALAWSVGALVERRPQLRRPAAAAAIVVSLTFAALTWHQIGFWSTTQTLFEHALEVTPANPVANEQLGLIARQSGDIDGAIRLYEQVLSVWPGFADAQTNLGEAFLAKREPAEAVPHLRAAIAAEPTSSEAEVDLGTALRELNDTPEAEEAYRAATRLKPGDGPAHFGLAECLVDDRLPNDAIVEARRALELAGSDADLRNAAYRLLVQLGRPEDAAHLAPDLAASSDGAHAHLDRGNALANAGQFEDAAAEFRAALAVDPSNAKTHANLGAALASLGRFDNAIDEFSTALRLNPDLPEVRRNLDLARELKRNK